MGGFLAERLGRKTISRTRRIFGFRQEGCGLIMRIYCSEKEMMDPLLGGVSLYVARLIRTVSAALWSRSITSGR